VPATYLETIEKLQQQGLETLKQAQAVQIATLTSIREIAASVPPTEVLGLQTTRPTTPIKPNLPTTGVNTVPLVAVAAACLLVGLALTRSRPARSRPDGSGDVEGEIDGRG